MKFKSVFLKVGIPVIAFALLIVLAAWAGHPQNPAPQTPNTQDTIPKKRAKVTREENDRDLDKQLRELDCAKKQLDELKEKDWDKIKKDIEESLKHVDLEKIKLDVEKALKEVDFVRIEKEIEASLRKIDFEKIERDIEKALKETNVKEELDKARLELQQAKIEIEQQSKNKEWRKEIEQELKKVNSEEIKKELENARREMEKAKVDLDLEKVNMSKELKKAGEEIEKAKEELQGYQEMIYSMEKEGLLSTKEDYKIEYDNGVLMINGKKQSQETMNKYKKYFKKDKTTLTKEGDDFNIDIDK